MGTCGEALHIKASDDIVTVRGRNVSQSSVGMQLMMNFISN